MDLIHFQKIYRALCSRGVWKLTGSTEYFKVYKHIWVCLLGGNGRVIARYA